MLSSLNAGISINERHWIISHVTFGSVKFKSSNWKPLKRGYRYELNNCILDREIREIIWECRCMPHFATSNSEYLEFIPFCSGKKLYCANMILKSISMDEDYGNTGCQVFKQGVQNWKDFCLKNYICTQMKLLNFKNWCSGKLSKIGHHFSNISI